MNTIRTGAVLAGLLCASLMAGAAPPAAEMLKFQPRQTGVNLSTPATEAEAAACKVELVNGPGSTSGWLLKDAGGLPLRKFVASKGAKANIDVWSYYLNGQEVYREIDTNDDKKPDQLRWFGAGGMKWGVDVNADGRIDGWKMISAEEVSQELLRAVATRDVGRFQALLLNDAELKALELSPAETTRLRESVNQAPAKFQAVIAKLTNVSDKAQWRHLETQSVQCIPAENAGGKFDLFKYGNGTVQYDSGGKIDWVTVGEIIQVGRAWRLVAAPTPGHSAEAEVVEGPNKPVQIPEALRPLIDQLQKIDQNAPRAGDPPAVVVRFNLARASVLERLAAQVQGPDRDQWVKQLADSLSAAAQNADKSSLSRLTSLLELADKGQPGGPLAGYIAYRLISAEYSVAMLEAKPNEVAKQQDVWREKLKSFIEKYATAEDAPDAILQVGMVSEFVGKETEAKNWYEMLVQKHGQHPLAGKAAGAIRRLGLEGQPLQLAAPVLGTNAPFDIAQHRGKVVIVYYWASWNTQSAGDFVKFKSLLQGQGSKELDLVTVNLDAAAQVAQGFLANNPAPGTHLFQPGGLESPLANQFGIMVLPNMFLVGKDGKVVSRTVQMSGLDDEIKKLTEK